MSEGMIIFSYIYICSLYITYTYILGSRYCFCKWARGWIG